MKKFLLLFAFLLNFLNLNAQYSTLGNDFWVSFMQNFNVPANCIIYITSPQGATGTVSMPGSGWSQNFTVGANASIGIQIPAAQNPNIENSNVVLNKGVHVVSNNPIAVYAANQRDASSDATLVLPVQALGDQYMIMSYTVLSGYPSEFIIIGVENNTSIQIIPKAAVIGGVGANVPFNITLNAGEVYMVQSNGDLTGSTVKATNLNTCNNFAVFAGNKCAYVPTTCTSCDHLYEQMIPLKAWGKNYITSPLMTRSSDQFRILAMENSTSIQINGGAPINLNAGQYYETSLSQASFITSNNPISVAQYSQGTTCDNTLSDPFMIILSPVEQFIDNIVFQAFNTDVIHQFYSNIITKTANTNLVTLDGSTLTGWSTIPSNNLFSYTRININQGTHILDSDSGLTAIVYGFGEDDSYGYLAGANVKVQQVGPSIVINNDTIPYSLFHDTICNNQLITFIADTSSHIYNIHWDFGDGNTANGANVSHSYQSSGTYNLTMYFTRPESCIEDSISTIININDISVQITPNNPQICSGNSIVLNVSGASTYSWNTGGNTASITVTPSATTTYTVTGTSTEGCTGTATITVSVNPTPDIASVSDQSLCANLLTTPINFISTVNNTLFNWINDNPSIGLAASGSGNIPSFTVINESLELQTATIIITPSFTYIGVTCTGASETFLINVYPLPIADFSVLPNHTYEDDDIVNIIDNSIGATSWYYDFGVEDDQNDIFTEREPIYRYNNEGKYNVIQIVENEYGCQDTTYNSVNVESYNTFYIPNAFTPNGNDLNELFNIAGTNINPNTFEMRIYDRWGKQLFYTTDINQGWDGTYKGEIVPQGSYTYIIKFEDSQGYKKEIVIGEVILLK